MPVPVSQMETQISGVAILPRRLENMQAQRATIWHRLDRIPDEIEKYLLQLDRETPDGPFAAVLLLEDDLVELHAARLQLENFIEKCAMETSTGCFDSR